VTERQDRRRFGEIASAVAVILSLIFVGLEVRESARQTELNTQSLQVTAYQDVIAQISTINLLNIEHPEIAQHIQSVSSISELPDGARGQIGNYYFLLTRHGDMAYYQYELGMLTEERLESALGLLNFMMCDPRYREFWTGNREAFVAGYREFIEAKISAKECRGEWRD
jgi:hypothetical protein